MCTLLSPLYSQNNRVPIHSTDEINLCENESNLADCSFPINPIFEHSVGMNYSFSDTGAESKIEGIAKKYR